VVQPDIPKQTVTNESCDRDSDPSRPKWMIVQVVSRRQTGVAVDDAIRVGEWHYDTPPPRSRNGRDQVPTLSLRSPLCFGSAPASTIRLQLDKEQDIPCRDWPDPSGLYQVFTRIFREAEDAQPPAY
jgi:hypothetical protein